MQLSIMKALKDCKPASLEGIFEARCPDELAILDERVKDHAPERRRMKPCPYSAKEQIELFVVSDAKEAYNSNT